jgi:signal transduction histidine kinase
MSSTAERSRGRLFAGLHFGEGFQNEQALAITRLLISMMCLVALWPLVCGHGALARLILLLYVLHSLAVLIRVLVGREIAGSFLVFVHAFDVVWPAFIFLLTGQPFLLLVFALVAATFRWEARETLLTAVASALILVLEPVFVSLPLVSRLRLLDEPLQPETLAVRTLGLLVLGGMLAYLGDQERGLSGGTAAVDSVLQNLHPEAGVRENLKAVLPAFLTILEAQGIVLVLRHSSTGRAFGLGVRRSSPGQLEHRRLSSSEADRYFLPMPGPSWSVAGSDSPDEGDALVLDRDGRRLKRASCRMSPRWIWNEPFHTLSAVDVRFGKEWTGRVFLVDAQCSADRQSCLRSFQLLVAEVAPAAYNSYLWRRIRARARLIERERIARDLHDGVIQTLVAMDMNIELLRRQGTGADLDATETVANAQRLIRREIRNLRGMIEQLRSDSPPRQFLDSLTATIKEFQRETGIEATLSYDVQDGPVPPRVSHEVVHIVREALCNVRKHSEARRVEVRLASNDNNCQVVIQDDGRGFDFTGRLSQAELQVSAKGPRVIQERVHCVNGELSIESYPDRGARLEISFARNG